MQTYEYISIVINQKVVKIYTVRLVNEKLATVGTMYYTTHMRTLLVTKPYWQAVTRGPYQLMIAAHAHRLRYRHTNLSNTLPYSLCPCSDLSLFSNSPIRFPLTPPLKEVITTTFCHYTYSSLLFVFLISIPCDSNLMLQSKGIIHLQKNVHKKKLSISKEFCDKLLTKDVKF